MYMQQMPYLTTEQAAAYLQMGERKLYELVSRGAVPCSKATGKWLFPRAALDRWVEAGMIQPDGVPFEAPPAIIGGSHDPLLEWAVRRSGCGLALLHEGSETGLARLARNEVAMAAIHIHRADCETGANARSVAEMPTLHDAVVIAFARREQGLVIATGNPLGITGLKSAMATGPRFGQRQKGAGAQLLLEHLASEAGLGPVHELAGHLHFPTGQDLALAIRGGEIDCGIATRAVAHAFGLGFIPLVMEEFDLVMRRRVYFESGMQALLKLLRKAEFGRQAASFGGYDVRETGQVRLNR